ncbi:AbrB family transcriptional regulator [Companilactobacillus nuruki]|uniref:AbrB family transcriptional regulator n=1 Tax=Companilactobacillus nuruki TaxID=1993540 RepID=A0A2N7ATT6_9LACO|nr:AbrB family transcriptional regulator [Companilactobacillus nuruki]PMD69848.1 AbrB family transcriptional regulator [Companilactobacillus nuruki]
MSQNDDSYTFRISEKKQKTLNANGNTNFEKIISSDGKKITFRKITSNHPNDLNVANQICKDHADLMKRLDNL